MNKPSRRARIRKIGPSISISPEEGPHFHPSVLDRLQDQIDLWTADKKDPTEWACVVTGKGPHEIDDFIVLPHYDVCRRRNSLSILVKDIRRIARHGKRIVGLLHTHPSGNLDLTPFDYMLFLQLEYEIESMTGSKDRGLVYSVAGPGGDMALYVFQKLRDHGVFHSNSGLLRIESEKPNKKR